MPRVHMMQVGVHSASANGLVKALLQQRMLTDLPPYTAVRQEVKYGKASSPAIQVLCLAT